MNWRRCTSTRDELKEVVIIPSTATCGGLSASFSAQDCDCEVLSLLCTLHDENFTHCVMCTALHCAGTMGVVRLGFMC